jgi:Tfp pilus assembly protein PilZ
MKERRDINMALSYSTPDRRVHARQSCLISVDYQIGGRTHRDFVRNISAGGLLIETGGKFVVGQEVSLTFMEPSFGKQTKMMAQIAWTGLHRIGLRFEANGKEVMRVGKVKRKRLIWDRSLSDKVTKYRVYWSRDGGIDYDSDYVEVGNVAQVILPDDIPSFPSVADGMELGVSAISEAGNESEITKIIVSVDFTIPEPPRDLKMEDFLDNP